MRNAALVVGTLALVFGAVSTAACAGSGSADGARSVAAATSARATTPEDAAATTPPNPPAGNAGPLDAGPVAARRPDKPNVILLSIDSLRADMPWTGYTRPIAPRLTELAKKAVVYTRGYAVSSYTSMSLGGLLAGRYPSELVRDGYFFGTYGKENLMFPELLKEKGVKTMGGHAHGYFKTAGFDQGFESWEIVPNLKWNNTTDENVTAPELLAIAEKMLANPALEDARFFAWFHFMDPHDKYLPHPEVPPYGKSLRDRYDAEVTYTDGYVGRLLDFVAKKSWASRTIWIVTADHGESFGEHGHYAHGFELWENLVRVPLFVVAPGAPPRVIDVPRSHIDLAPTLLELFDVPAPTDLRGKSLTAEIYGAAAEPRDVFIDLPITSDNDRRRAVVSGPRKVISFGTQGLRRTFDVVADPGELSPLKLADQADMPARFKALDDAIKERPPTRCKEGCLNGAYLKKDAGP